MRDLDARRQAPAPDRADDAGPDEVERSLAQAYLLLATLLARPPSATLLEGLAALPGDGTPWGRALAAMAEAARATDEAQAEREFNRLFIGLQRGELLPYASFYKTGFLHDQPLVHVRTSMARLGIARRDGVPEPEDHIAALLEIRAGLLAGSFGAQAGRADRQAFHDRHLADWAPRFFRDLEGAREARFYRTVGAAGTLLFEIEENASVLAS